MFRWEFLLLHGDDQSVQCRHHLRGLGLGGEEVGGGRWEVRRWHTSSSSEPTPSSLALIHCSSLFLSLLLSLLFLWSAAVVQAEAAGKGPTLQTCLFSLLDQPGFEPAPCDFHRSCHLLPATWVLYCLTMGIVDEPVSDAEKVNLTLMTT